MGTFHDNLGPLHGMTVVVDTNGPRVVIGRCHEVTEERVILHDADIHEDGAEGVSKADYLKRAKQVGTWARHPNLSVPLSEVASIQLLGELKVE
jgi:hypothetical protein